MAAASDGAAVRQAMQALVYLEDGESDRVTPGKEQTQIAEVAATGRRRVAGEEAGDR